MENERGHLSYAAINGTHRLGCILQRGFITVRDVAGVDIFQHVDVCFSHGHLCEVVDGVEALRKAVRYRLRTGAHVIKVMTSGGVFSLTDPILIPQYSPEELRAVTEEAGRRGSYVAAHAYSSAATVVL